MGYLFYNNVKHLTVLIGVSLCSLSAATAEDARRPLSGGLDVITATADHRVSHNIPIAKRVAADRAFDAACKADPALRVSGLVDADATSMSISSLGNPPSEDFQKALESILSRSTLRGPKEPSTNGFSLGSAGVPITVTGYEVIFACHEKYTAAAAQAAEAAKRQAEAKALASMTIDDIVIDNSDIGISRDPMGVPVVALGPRSYVTFPSGEQKFCPRIKCLKVTPRFTYPERLAMKGVEGAIRLRAHYENGFISRVDVVEEVVTGGGGRNSSFARAASRELKRSAILDEGLAAFPAVDFLLVYRLAD